MIATLFAIDKDGASSDALWTSENNNAIHALAFIGKALEEVASVQPEADHDHYEIVVEDS